MDTHTHSYGQCMNLLIECFKFTMFIFQKYIWFIKSIGDGAEPNILHRNNFLLTFMKSKFHIYELGMVFYTCNSSTWEVRQENQEFKGILSHIANLRSAWVNYMAWDLASKENKKFILLPEEYMGMPGSVFTLKHGEGKQWEALEERLVVPWHPPPACHLLVTAPVLVLCPDLTAEQALAAYREPGEPLAFLFSRRSHFSCQAFEPHCRFCLFCTKEPKTCQRNK